MHSSNCLVPLALLAVACKPDPVSKDSDEDNVDPTAEITSHADGDQLLSGYTVSFEGVVVDENDEATTLSTTWYMGDVQMCGEAAPDADGLSVCEWTISIFGEEPLNLRVSDPHGGGGFDYKNMIIEQTGPPTLYLASPDEEGRFYSDVTVVLSGTVVDEDEPSDELWAWWESDVEGDLGEITIDPDTGAVSAEAMLSTGTHVITAYASDPLGQVGTTVVTIEVGGNNNVPTCGVTNPSDGTVLPFGDDNTFEGWGDDLDIPEEELLVTWTSDVDGEIFSGTLAADGTTSFDSDLLSVSEHLITLTVTDDARVSCESSIMAYVDTRPEVEIGAPLGGAVYNEDEAIIFTASFADDDTGPASLTATWVSSLDGEFSTQTASSESPIAFFTYEGLALGHHELTVTVTDPLGLTATDHSEFVVNGLPSQAVISINPTSPTTDDDLSVTLDVPSVDPEGETVTYLYTWYADGRLVGASSLSRIASSSTETGETWRVVVVPSDPYGDGPETEAEVVIGGSR